MQNNKTQEEFSLVIDPEVKADNHLVIYNDDVNTFDFVIESELTTFNFFTAFFEFKLKTFGRISSIFTFLLIRLL